MRRKDRRSGNSYKKAIYKGGGIGTPKWAKRQAAKAVRRYKGPIPDGGYYKKIYDSWSIHDYVSDCAHHEPFWPRDKRFKFDGVWYISK